jgi:hypothetical protein
MELKRAWQKIQRCHFRTKNIGFYLLFSGESCYIEDNFCNLDCTATTSERAHASAFAAPELWIDLCGKTVHKNRA